MRPSILSPSPTSPPPHPSGLSQRNSFECPASCIELALQAILCIVIRATVPWKSYALVKSLGMILPCSQPSVVTQHHRLNAHEFEQKSRGSEE